MPQPLSRVKNITTREGGPGIILKRPELALLVTAVITSWSHAEANLGRFLAVCLRAESSAGVAMYLSLSGAEARRSALEAAATKSLDTDEFALFSLIMKAIRPVRDRRNDFAHGIWSISVELPDALLWDKADNTLDAYERGLKNLPNPGPQTMVYRKRDLEADLLDAKAAAQATHGLAVLINPHDKHAHEAMRKILSASPLLQRYGGYPTS